jgi:hypothetical protein
MNSDPATAVEPKVDPKRQIILFLSIAYPMALAVPSCCRRPAMALPCSASRYLSSLRR